MIRRARSRSAAIPRSLLDDDRLSYRARGVAAFILGKPDGWRIDARSLARMSTEGRDAVLTALRELQDLGYLVRRRQQVAGGHWTTESVLYETPADALDDVDEQVAPSPENPDSAEVGLPEPGQPEPGRPGRSPCPARENPPSPHVKGAVGVELDAPPAPVEDPPPPPAAQGAHDAPRRGNGTSPRQQGTNPRGPRPPTDAELADRRAREAEAATAARLDELRAITPAPPRFDELRNLLVKPEQPTAPTEEDHAA